MIDTQEDSQTNDYLEGLLQDKKQLSEIIEDEREVEGDNGNVTYSKGTGNFGTGDSGDSKANTTLQVISSMGSSSQQPAHSIRGIGIGLTNANENYNIVRSENGDDRNVQELVNNMIEGTLTRDDNHASYIGYINLNQQQPLSQQEYSQHDGHDLSQSFDAVIVEHGEPKTAGLHSMRVSEMSFDDQEDEAAPKVNRFDAQSAPQLDPKDLEDLAAIVDRLRVLCRKKDEQKVAPKKLIAKNPGRVDELAGEFDKRLT